MSLSTTTTATYALVKYSRAYNHTSHTQAEQGELQWQHFVNPIIRLTMDTRKAVDGHLESYRLRITWQFSAGLDSMDVDQREVVFEDLDLVTYASLPSLQAPQGMPLKAVYQEAVVGIRYQHPRVVVPGTTPQYRRFQIVFDSVASAFAFIESIRYVCPCKANAPPPPRMQAPRASTALSGSQMPATSAPSVPPRPTARPSIRPAASVLPEDSAPPVIRRTGTTLPSFSTLTNATSNWDAPPAPYPTQALPSRSMSVSPAYSSGSGAVSARDDHGYNLSRPSSAVADHSSSSSSGPASAVSASAAVPVPALVQARTPAHTASYASAPAPSPAHASSPSRANTIARPPQIQSSTTMLAHSGSSDTSLPSSSFPHSSSSSPPMARLRPSSPDLMPPPPLPAVAAAPRIVTISPTATQAAIPAPAPVPAPMLTPAAPPAAAASTSSSATTPFAAAQDAIPSAHPGPGETMPRTSVPTSTVPTPDMTASLRDSAGLYALPKDELEKLVAEVIREDGFADLMKALDGMWRVKGLVGIA